MKKYQRSSTEKILQLILDKITGMKETERVWTVNQKIDALGEGTKKNVEESFQNHSSKWQ